ncbi:MAG: c-type cytochrome [Acidobacteriota bacterium]
MRLQHALPVFAIVLMTASITSAHASAGAQTPAGAQPPAGGQPPAAGGRGAAPAEPHNLKVLPTSTTTAQILPIMRNFSAALGTNCGHCHVWTAAGDPSNDYAADTKPAKVVARVMMQMVGEINQKLAANIQKPADQLTAVGCMTCHRGEIIPKLPPPAARGAGAGAPPAGAPPAGAPPAPGR